MPELIRVLLADADHRIRGALAGLLALHDDLAVEAEASTGAEALSMARAHRPDVAVMDLRMPDLDGIAVARSLHSEVAGCHTIVITDCDRPEHLRRALKEGVRGFLSKTVSAHDLAGFIRTVHAGRRCLGSELVADAISAGGPGPA